MEQPKDQHASWEGELFRLLVENTKDYAVFVIDLDGTVLTWNPGAERVLGYAEREIVGRSSFVTFTPEDRAEGVPQGELETTIRDGRAEDTRWHLRKDGTRLWVNGVMLLLREGGRPRACAKVMRDFTEAKLAQERLCESEERLRVALSAAQMGTWLWRIAADQQIVDDSLREMVGLEPGEEVQSLEGFLGAIHDEDRGRVRAEFERCRDEGGDFDVEFRVAGPGGTRWLKDQGKAFPGPDGHPVFIAGACVDITERKAMEESMRQASSELERLVEERTSALRQALGRAIQAERLAAIGQTVATVAHEGRNALQRIHGCLERLGLRVEDRPEALKLVGRSQEALADLEHLFDDIRSYAAPIQLDQRLCDLSEVWREAWSRVLGTRSNRDARLSQETGGRDLRCEVDPFRLGQVFRNLF